MGRKRETVARTCTVCGGEFYKPPSHLAKWPALTCSRKCAAVLRLRGEERSCRVCGKSFYVTGHQVKNGFGIYCSNACNGVALRDRVQVSCSNCGLEFTVTPHEFRTRQKHLCNRLCRVTGNSGITPSRTRELHFSFKQKREWLGPACVQCGSTERLELDHIVPVFAGGLPTRDNAQTLCRDCNSCKRNDDLSRYSPSLSCD